MKLQKSGEYVQTLEPLFREVIEVLEMIGLDRVKEHSVTVPQYRVLVSLFLKGRCTMGDLARSASIGLSTMTGIVDRLVKRGFLSRVHSEEDRRRVYISLTDLGTAAVGKIVSHKNALIERIMEKLDHGDREVLFRAFSTLGKVLESEGNGLPEF